MAPSEGEEQARTVWGKHPIVRVILLALTILACVLLGLRSGAWLVGVIGPDARQLFTGVTLASVVFGTWKIVLTHGRDLFQFARGLCDWSKVEKAHLELLLVVTGYGVVGSTLAPATNAIVATSFIYAGAEPSISTNNRVLLPVFPNDVPANNAATLTCEDKLKRLAEPDKRTEEGIRQLACGLRSCSGPKPAEQVVIDVQGFASSREFACNGGPSNDWNLKLAEARRQSIAAILNSSLENVGHCASLSDKDARLGVDHPLQFDPNLSQARWKEISSMVTARQLVDEQGTDVDRGREILSRRVDIVIKSKGKCGGSPPIEAHGPLTVSRTQ